MKFVSFLSGPLSKACSNTKLQGESSPVEPGKDGAIVKLYLLDIAEVL